MVIKHAIWSADLRRLARDCAQGACPPSNDQKTSCFGGKEDKRTKVITFFYLQKLLKQLIWKSENRGISLILSRHIPFTKIIVITFFKLCFIKRSDLLIKTFYPRFGRLILLIWLATLERNKWRKKTNGCIRVSQIGLKNIWVPQILNYLISNFFTNSAKRWSLLFKF